MPADNTNLQDPGTEGAPTSDTGTPTEAANDPVQDTTAAAPTEAAVVDTTPIADPIPPTITRLTPAAPTKIGAVAEDIRQANQARVDAIVRVQTVSDELATAETNVNALRSSLTAAQANVTTATQAEINELNEAIQILENRRDTLAATL